MGLGSVREVRGKLTSDVVVLGRALLAFAVAHTRDANTEGVPHICAYLY